MKKNGSGVSGGKKGYNYERMYPILLATKNQGKIIEAKEALSDIPLTLLTPADIPGFPKEIPEEGSTFQENALAKARFAHAHAPLRQAQLLAAASSENSLPRAGCSGSRPVGGADRRARGRAPACVNCAVLADDSGIIVEALRHELGVHTRRWGAGPQASDEEWIAFFLERMRHEENQHAEFVCVLALIEADGSEHLFEGRCTGLITESLEADYLPGLPISACFKPDGHACVFSALSVEEKNAVSHRGRAMMKLRAFLTS